jgi:hypothetical protein
MYADPARTKAMTDEEVQVVLRKHTALGDEMLAADELVGGCGLALPEETRTLRLGSAGVDVSTGPLTDETEQLTAYYEIECATEERALEIAGRVLDDHVTAVELRAVHDTARRPD